ncbi:MSP domain protein [Necator americanus]|uniref:Major sperm protein n=1 Tax=Necator americanus TaxID=51031 RepID=W2TFT1_NECAM|nr:MSP domain protein [Necator americanus]ETN80895.1 MSP domain protein [Necator americanus]
MNGNPGTAVSENPMGVYRPLPTPNPPPSQALWVMNKTSKMIAFKIKCSNNRAFWIKPVFGVIESGNGAEIEVNRIPNITLKNDKIVVCCAKYSVEDGALEVFFKRPTTITEDKVIRQMAIAATHEQFPIEPRESEKQLTIMKC